MPASDLQLSYGGLTVGSGTPYRIRSISGLRDFTIRSSDDTSSTRWGSFIGSDQVESSAITIEFVYGFDPAVTRDLTTAFSPSVQGSGDDLYPLAWKWPDEVELYRYARVRKRTQPMNYQTERAGGATTMIVELQAPDPRAYAVAADQASLPAYTEDSLYGVLDVGSGTSLGDDLNVGSGTSLGADLTGTGGSGTVFVANDGNTDTWPTVTFTGNMTRWRLRNLTTGTYVEFSYPLGAGQTFVVDFPARATPKNGDVVLIDGVAYYAAWLNVAGLGRTPLVIPPGVSELRFDVLEGDPTSAAAFVEVHAAFI